MCYRLQAHDCNRNFKNVSDVLQYLMISGQQVCSFNSSLPFTNRRCLHCQCHLRTLISLLICQRQLYSCIKSVDLGKNLLRRVELEQLTVALPLMTPVCISLFHCCRLSQLTVMTFCPTVLYFFSYFLSFNNILFVCVESDFYTFMFNILQRLRSFNPICIFSCAFLCTANCGKQNKQQSNTDC